MNIINPPVFDHIIAFGGGSWIPFEDSYTFDSANVTGVGLFPSMTARTRDYSLCTGMSVLISTPGPNPFYQHVDTIYDAGTIVHYQGWIIPGSPNVGIKADCVAHVGNEAPLTFTIKITGWAPAP